MTATLAKVKAGAVLAAVLAAGLQTPSPPPNPPRSRVQRPLSTRSARPPPVETRNGVGAGALGGVFVAGRVLQDTQQLVLQTHAANGKLMRIHPGG